jgi:ketosteroid isomerase-like protein
VVFTLLPNGITLDVRDIVADEAGVVLTVRGDAAGVNGEYDNDYAMVFRIRDGRIISFEEFCSDLLVETRLFERELVEIE